MYEIWLISGSFLLGVGFTLGMMKIFKKDRDKLLREYLGFLNDIGNLSGAKKA